MAARISDLITVHARPPFPDPSVADRGTIINSFVLTSETAPIAARVLQRLASYPKAQPGGLIFTGDSGVGKTHLLRYLASLLESPNDPQWEVLRSYLQSETRLQSAMNSLFVPIPTDPSISLASYFAERLAVQSSGPGVAALSGPEPAAEEFTRLAQGVASDQARRSLGLLVLEDISSRLEQFTDPERTQWESNLIKIVTDSFSSKGILVVLVMAEKYLTQDRESGPGTPALQSLSNTCDFIWLSRNNIVEIIATALATKSDGQRAEIRNTLNRLRQKLPFLGPKAESFIDLYPVHPHVFNALFQLRLILPGFSPLRFVQMALETHTAQPADHPVTLDVLFDHLQAELRTYEEHQSLLESYDELAGKVIPQLKPKAQTQTRLLVKGISFLTICESQIPSVKGLANSLLLFDESDFLPGYSLAATLLTELERKGSRYLMVEGEGLDRKYRLLPLESESGIASARELLEQQADFVLELPRLVHDWLKGEILDWKRNRSAGTQSSYQYLVTSLPARDTGPSGMVHFKSVVDPLWSLQDLEALQESAFSWVVLILSPYERFYELDPLLRELAAKSRRLMIWRPDAPTSRENARLRALITQGISKAIETRARMKARRELHEILGTLYVERGLLITSSDEWCVGDAIGNKTLEEYLSLHLSELAHVSAEKTRQPDRAARGADLEAQARHWASLLCGEEFKNGDPKSVENRVREWWALVDPATIQQKLQALPESFLTIQFWDKVKPAQTQLEILASIMTRLSAGDTGISEAMLETAALFNNDENRLQTWKESLGNLTALLAWFPHFEEVRDYLYSALIVDQKQLEQLRNDLRERTERPEEFLTRDQRAAFDAKFLDFKQGYIDYYYARHEEALQPVAETAKPGAAVDQAALRNLEILSKLLYTDKSFLNRAQVISKWVESYQCTLPVREILERYPRCYCNFNPLSSARALESVKHLNSEIQEGLNYFRTILRRCSKFIIPDLKTNRVDDYHSKQIAALLSQGAMIPLKPQCVEILNRIIEKHSAEFLSHVRAYTRPASGFTPPH